MPEPKMTPAMYGPDITFAGVPRVSLASLADGDGYDVVYAVSAAGAMPVILGGDHTITFPDATGVARHAGWGRVSLIHFDAHAARNHRSSTAAARRCR
jgi:arginase family enzyme